MWADPIQEQRTVEYPWLKRIRMPKSATKEQIKPMAGRFDRDGLLWLPRAPSPVVPALKAAEVTRTNPAEFLEEGMITRRPKRSAAHSPRIPMEFKSRVLSSDQG